MGYRSLQSWKMPADPEPWRDDASFRTVAMYLGVFLVVLAAVFSNNAACLLCGLDGTAWSIALDAQAMARLPYSQLGVDPYQGLFDAYYPAYRELLLPSALAMLVGVASVSKAVTYFTYAALLLVSTYILARVIGFPRVAAFLGGALLVALGLPTLLDHGSLLYSIYSLLPHLAQEVSLTLLIIACLWALRDRPAALTIAIGAAAVACVLFAVASFVTLTVLMAPAIMIYGTASLLDFQRWRQNLPRCLAGGAMVAAPAACGMFGYVYSIATYTAYNYFSHELMQSRPSLDYASIIYLPDRIGLALVLVGLAGALYAGFGGQGRVRIFAWTHIVATGVFQLCAFLVVRFAQDYHGPSPIYFEFMFWPMHSLFAALILVVGLRAIARIIVGALPWPNAAHWFNPRHVALGAVPLMLAGSDAAISIKHPTTSCPGANFSPIRPTAISEVLGREIAIRPGVPFRGLVATFDGARGKPSVTWFDLVANDFLIWQRVGNDLRSDGLWWYRIPTLFQYSPLITPPFYLMTTEFLSRPSDKQVRNIVALTQPNQRMLRLWGVRYLITDSELGFGRPVLEMPGPEGVTLSLIAVDEANLGDYSPTRVRPVTDFEDGLQVMHNRDFDGRRDVVTEAALTGPLVPARDAKLIYEKTGFTVAATSEGRSTLVLPIQFSRCWTVSGAGDPVLFRADLMQLGIAFSGRLDATLVFRFGPFWSSGCRIDDIRDMERLRVRDARIASVENNRRFGEASAGQQ